MPGWDVTSVDYAVALALGEGAVVGEAQSAAHQRAARQSEQPVPVNKYLRRARRRARQGLGQLGRQRKLESDDAAREPQNAVLADRIPREEPGSVSYLKMQTVLRLIVLKVMYENDIDVFVNPENTLPPFMLGGPTEPTVNNRGSASCCWPFHGALGRPRDGSSRGLHAGRLRAAVCARRGQEELRIRHGHRRIAAPEPDADQPHVLVRPRQRPRGDQSRLRLRSGDATPRAAAGVRAGARREETVASSSRTRVASPFRIGPLRSTGEPSPADWHSRRPADPISVVSRLPSARIWGELNGSMQHHLRLTKEVVCMGMGRPGPAGLSSAARADMWRRWKAGYRMREIARALRWDHGSIRNLLAQRGGIGPSIRRRARQALTLAEREDISRGIAADDSARSIAARIGRAPSTVSREITRHGGRSSTAPPTLTRWPGSRRCVPNPARLL